jgi:putative component of toxin-antitoxin plasmid stabilization module
MPRFSLERLDLVQGRQLFYNLFRDGVSAFEEFCNDIETDGRYLSELRTIFAYMEMVANLQMLPQQKMRDLTTKNDKTKEYELKTKHLRVYFIHQEKTGKVVILGGFKTTQPKDIDKFRAIKKEYINSL